MKKYLLGVLAIAMAIGFSAFTAPKEAKIPTTSTSVVVYFVGNDITDPNQVSDPAMWDNTDPGLTCTSFTTTKGCSFQLDDNSDYDFTADQVRSSVTLNTSGSAAGYYVSSISNSVSTISSITFQP